MDHTEDDSDPDYPLQEWDEDDGDYRYFLEMLELE